MTTDPSDIVERLRAACVGHPHANIPWPHRLLHDAMGEIELLREVKDLRQQMLALAAAVKRLAFEVPPPNEYTPKFVQMALEAERIARDAGRQRKDRGAAQLLQVMQQLPPDSQRETGMAGIDNLAAVMGRDGDLDPVERDRLCEEAAAEITRLRAALAEHDDPVTYKGMNDWLDEFENFSLRRERVPDGAMPWIETAWRLATLAEREWCARVADERHRAALKRMEAAVTEDGGTIFDMEQATAAYIAAAIRSRGS